MMGGAIEVVLRKVLILLRKVAASNDALSKEALAAIIEIETFAKSYKLKI